MQKINFKTIWKKYNWWSKDKENISDEAKIEYILKFGDLDEILFVIKNYKNLVLEKLNYFLVDPTISLKRKKMIYFLVKQKELSDEDYKKFLKNFIENTKK